MNNISFILLFCLIGFLNFNVQGQPDCDYFLNQTNLAVPHARGNYSFNVNTHSGCARTVKFDGCPDYRPANLIFTSPAGETGSAKVDFTIAATQTRSNRSGQTVTVSQFGNLNQPTLVTALGRAVDSNGRGVRNALIEFTNTITGEKRFAVSNHFGFFRFANTRTNEAHTIIIIHKRYSFPNSILVYTEEGQFTNFHARP
jgi:hypothetical protein